jgi:hypothetical protein
MQQNGTHDDTKNSAADGSSRKRGRRSEIDSFSIVSKKQEPEFFREQNGLSDKDSTRIGVIKMQQDDAHDDGRSLNRGTTAAPETSLTHQELLLKYTAIKEECAALEAKTKEITLQNAALEAKTKEITLQNAALEAKTKVMRSRTLQALAENPPQILNATISESHVEPNKPPRHYIRQHLELESLNLPESFWDTLHSLTIQTGGRINSETHVNTLSIDTIVSVLKGLGLNDDFICQYEMNIGGVRADGSIARYDNLIPCGSIEGKKPSRGRDGMIFGSEGCGPLKVAGQVSEQLNMIRLGSVTNTFGLVTTFSKWMLVSTGELPVIDVIKELVSKTIARRGGNVSAETGTPARVEEEAPSTEVSPESFFLTAEREASSGEIEDIENSPVYTSQVFEFNTENGHDTIKMIAAAVVLMWKSCAELRPKLINKPNIVSVVRLIDFEKNQMAFQKRSFATCLEYNDYACAAGKLHLIFPLGGGQKGSCCLARTEDGKTCAIKFFHTESWDETQGTPAQVAEIEAQNWRKINHQEAIVKNVPGYTERPCLIMPFLQPIAKAERKECLQNLRPALEMFAGSGFIHIDLKWRHIGRFQGNIMFCDLGQDGLEELEGNEACNSRVESWIEEVLGNLRRSM